MKRIILTMLDNNDSIWYEQLVPFLLSLKKTDYDGDIGVISYGLSESKQQILEKFGCKVFPALHRYSELLVDRQFTVAHIAETEDYDQLAMFDADIWFPHSKLDIFAQISDEDKLYCAPDVWICSFLFSCIDEPLQSVAHDKLYRLRQENGYVWQAGMIAGHKNAWLNYRTFAEKQLTQPELKMEYGIDATLLNLYAVDCDGVRGVSRKYNCLPAWGIFQENHGQGIVFMINGEPVQAIHVSRAHRKGGEYFYQNLYRDEFLQQGVALQLKEYPYYHILPESLTNNTPAENPVKLTLDKAETNGEMRILVDRDGVFYKKNAVLVDVAGISKIRFKNKAEQAQTLHFYYQSLLGYDICDDVKLISEDNTYPLLEPNKLVTYLLPPEHWIEFQVNELNVSGKHIRWVFEDLNLLEKQ